MEPCLCRSQAEVITDPHSQSASLVFSFSQPWAAFWQLCVAFLVEWPRLSSFRNLSFYFSCPQAKVCSIALFTAGGEHRLTERHLSVLPNLRATPPQPHQVGVVPLLVTIRLRFLTRIERPSCPTGPPTWGSHVTGDSIASFSRTLTASLTDVLYT